jgi:hypothetical protein
MFFNKNRSIGGRAVMGAVYVAYHPKIPHRITRRGYLGVNLAFPYADGIPFFNDTGAVPYGGKAEAVFRKEAVVVYLRLGMVVVGITRPFARNADNFAYDQIGLASVGIVKYRAYHPG